MFGLFYFLNQTNDAVPLAEMTVKDSSARTSSFAFIFPSEPRLPCERRLKVEILTIIISSEDKIKSGLRLFILRQPICGWAMAIAVASGDFCRSRGVGNLAGVCEKSLLGLGALPPPGPGGRGLPRVAAGCPPAGPALPFSRWPCSNRRGVIKKS